MIKAVLRYTDCMQDGRNVYAVLTSKMVPIIRTSRSWSMYPKITILLRDYEHLNNILNILNTKCTYEVRLVKYKKIKEI